MRKSNEDDEKKKYGVNDLPLPIKRSFNKEFTPQYIEYLGMSKDPWNSHPSADILQKLFAIVYPDISGVVILERGAIWQVVSVCLFHLN